MKKRMENKIQSNKKRFDKGFVKIPLLIIFFGIALFLVSSSFQSKKSLLNRPPEESRYCAPDNDPNPPVITAFDYETCSTDGKCINIFDGQVGRPLETIEYIRIKKNVPIAEHSYTGSYCNGYHEDSDCDEPNDIHFVQREDIDVNGKRYARYYPNGENGNISYDFPGSDGRDTFIKMADYKLLYLVHLVSGQNAGDVTRDRKYADIAGFDPVIPERYKRYWITDVYIAKDKKNSLPQDVLECKDKVLDFSGPTSTPMVSRNIIVPSQSVSQDKKQLQIQYLTIEEIPDRALSQSWWTPHCKPAIYLYPEKEEIVKVEVNTKGILTHTDPPYKDGWISKVLPNGDVFIGGKKYDYLYFESKIPDEYIEKPKKGFVVSYFELPKLFDQILPLSGLRGKEISQFKQYWESVLPYSNYYFVGVIDEQNINAIEPLQITPAPDTIIRVRFYFEALSSWKGVVEPLPKPKERNGFTVVEWGGMVKLHSASTFTCSQ